MNAYEKKIAEGAKPFLADGEEVKASFIARPRGWTQTVAGSRNLGLHQQHKAVAGAELAGFQLASPMALAVTQDRLLSLRIGSPIGMGIGGKVKALAGAAPVEEVDSIEVRRLGLAQVITVTVRGVPFTLEANARAAAKSLAATLVNAKSANS
jgi:hypothetical protein